MATSKQFAPDLQSIGPVIQNAVKSMRGKYDKRKGNAKNFTAGKRGIKPGPKPNWVKNMSSSRADKTLQEFDSIVSPAQIYAELHAQKRFMDLWTMRCDVENRLMGRPFVALNPAEVKQSPALQQDNRLQLAIQNLNITATANQRTIRKQLAGDSPGIRHEPQVIDSTSDANAGK